jgi:hypothetical protein
MIAALTGIGLSAAAGLNACRAVDTALARAGMDAPTRGANLLRHSLATAPWDQPVVAFDLEGSVGQDPRRARDVDVVGS